MDLPRQQMIDEILHFVSRHPDSTASLAVTRRILGDPADRRGDDPVKELRQRIDDADDGVLASLYDIIS